MTTTIPVRWQDFLQKIDPLDDRTLRWRDILRITGLEKSQVKLKIDSDEFPSPFLITDSGRSLGWHASEVSAWCAARDALRDAMRGQARGKMSSLKKVIQNLKRPQSLTRAKKAVAR